MKFLPQIELTGKAASLLSYAMLIADSIALMVYEIRSDTSTLSKYQQSTNLILVIIELGFVIFVNKKSSYLVYIVNVVVTLFIVYNLLSQSNAVYNLVISYLSLSIVIISNTSLLVLEKFFQDDSDNDQIKSNFSTSGPTYIQDFDDQINNLNPKRLERCKIRDKCDHHFTPNMKAKFEDREIDIDADIYAKPLNNIMNEIRLSHFDDEQYEDLEMLLEFQNLEKLTVYEDNIYANDVSLTDVLELHSRLNDKEELAINISFTDTRFFTNFNRLANKTSDNDDGKEIKQRLILEYRLESDDDDPEFYDSFNYEDDDVQVVEGTVEEVSEVAEDDADGNVTVEEVTTVAEGLPTEEVEEVAESGGTVDESTSNALGVEETTDAAEPDGDQPNDDGSAEQLVENVEENGDHDEQGQEEVTDANGLDDHSGNDIPADSVETFEVVESEQSTQPAHTEEAAVIELDNAPSKAGDEGNDDLQTDAEAVEMTEVDATAVVDNSTGEVAQEEVIESVEIPTSDSPSLATSKRSIDEVDADNELVDTGDETESKRVKGEQQLNA